MLRILFCTNPQLDRQLINDTRRIVQGTHIKAEPDSISYQPYGLLTQLGQYPSGDNLVVVLSHNTLMDGRELALRVRAAFRDAYIIYFSENTDDLIFLTNSHIRLSGYVTEKLHLQAYAQVLATIYNDYMEKQLQTSRVFSVIVAKQVNNFFLDEILFFESMQKKIRLNMAGKTFEFYDSLTSLENRMKRYFFVRCHNSYLFNPRHVKEISLKDLSITLSGKVKIPISQKYKDEVIQLVGMYR